MFLNDLIRPDLPSFIPKNFDHHWNIINNASKSSNAKPVHLFMNVAHHIHIDCIVYNIVRHKCVYTYAYAFVFAFVPRSKFSTSAIMDRKRAIKSLLLRHCCFRCFVSWKIGHVYDQSSELIAHYYVLDNIKYKVILCKSYNKYSNSSCDFDFSTLCQLCKRAYGGEFTSVRTPFFFIIFFCCFFPMI